jgi:hypothetical protein
VDLAGRRATLGESGVIRLKDKAYGSNRGNKTQLVAFNHKGLQEMDGATENLFV